MTNIQTIWCFLFFRWNEMRFAFSTTWLKTVEERQTLAIIGATKLCSKTFRIFKVISFENKNRWQVWKWSNVSSTLLTDHFPPSTHLHPTTLIGPRWSLTSPSTDFLAVLVHVGHTPVPVELLGRHYSRDQESARDNSRFSRTIHIRRA